MQRYWSFLLRYCPQDSVFCRLPIYVVMLDCLMCHLATARRVESQGGLTRKQIFRLGNCSRPLQK